MNRFAVYTASLHRLFPKLNTDALRHKSPMDLDLLTMVISKNFDNLTNKEQTEKFFETVVFSKENLSSYFQSKLKQIFQLATGNPSYKDWYRIAEERLRLTDILFNMGWISIQVRSMIYSRVMYSKHLEHCLPKLTVIRRC